MSARIPYVRSRPLRNLWTRATPARDALNHSTSFADARPQLFSKSHDQVSRAAIHWPAASFTSATALRGSRESCLLSRVKVARCQRLLDQHQLSAVMHLVLFDRESIVLLFTDWLPGINTAPRLTHPHSGHRKDANASADRCNRSMISAFVRGTCSSALSFANRPGKS